MADYKDLVEKVFEENQQGQFQPVGEDKSRPEIEEPEFSKDQTEAAEDNLERNRRVLALEIATSVGHLFKDSKEFWDFTDDVVRYLK